MVDVIPHPHMYVADFINKYEAYLKPELDKKRDLKQLAFIVGDIKLRFNLSEKLSGGKEGVYQRYRLAVEYLAGLAFDTEHLSPENLDYVHDSVDRQVNELEIILGEDPVYLAHRETSLTHKP